MTRHVPCASGVPRGGRALRRRNRLRVAAGLVAMATATGCGLSPSSLNSIRSEGVAGSAAGAVNGAGGGGGGGGTAGGGGGTAGGGTASAAGGGVSGGGVSGGGVSGGGVSGGSAGSGSNGGGTSASGVSGGGGSRSSAGGGGAGGGSCGVPSGGNTTGIHPTNISVGLHAPLTGTGTPFPNSSFELGATKFFDQPGIAVCGRQVTVDFQDDTYSPAGANRVCSAMATRDFVVIGGAGTDQIQACATNTGIDSSGTPYLSAGVTTNGLTGLPNYFALSLTYAQQGALVTRDAQANGFATPPAATGDGNAQWAVVTANTQNFDDATQGIDTALSGAGISYHNFRIDQSGNYDSAATQLGQKLALDGYKTIYVDLAPGYFVFMTQGYYDVQPSGNGVNWTGPGVTFTDFEVAQLECSGSKDQISGHAYFLAPFPGLDSASPAFQTAFGGKYDDIEWSLWGLDQLIYEMLQKASGNLTRQHFIATTLASSFPGGTFPAVAYNGQHFGGTAAWAQRIDCSRADPDQSQPGYWDTLGSAPLAK